jgi:acyl-CoA thioesterase
MTPTEKARDIVDQMYSKDAFSQWLGIQRLMVEPGRCRLQMTVREEMTNGFKIAHGGITYSLADSALAFAANGHGVQSLSIDTSINHLKPVKIGDVITAEAKEVNVTRRTGIYQIEITNQDDELVAVFKGVVYRTERLWESKNNNE